VGSYSGEKSMRLYFVSFKRECRNDYHVTQLTRDIEAVPGAKIVDGWDGHVLTIDAQQSALARIQDMNHVNVQPYRELSLL